MTTPIQIYFPYSKPISIFERRANRDRKIFGLLKEFNLSEGEDYSLNYHHQRTENFPAMVINDDNPFDLDATEITGRFQIEKYLEQNAEKLRGEKNGN